MNIAASRREAVERFHAILAAARQPRCEDQLVAPLCELGASAAYYPDRLAGDGPPATGPLPSPSLA